MAQQESSLAISAYGGPSGDASSIPSGSSALLHRNLHIQPYEVVGSKGPYIHLKDGRRILDATSGAAVSCIGHGDERVKQAMLRQLDQVSYCLTLMFATEPSEALAREVVAGTGGVMERLYVVSSGSEAMDAAMKLARQYFLEGKPAQPQRTRFIARKQSYHGTTLGPLALGGHIGRRGPFEPLLADNCSRVSPCYAYRGKSEGETDETYVQRLANELDGEFQRVGPDTVCAFVAEPVVGAALGCVPSVPGYFKAVKAICDKYGALLIMDEVMAGMGRCGTLHAWQSPTVGVVPDIQTIGKGLGGGYAPIAGVLVGKKVIAALSNGSGAFVHGQTYQGHPVSCAAALEVQKIIREENLVANADNLGIILEQGLREKVAGHKYVGDIRGRGLFWGIEFVKDKNTKEPLDPKLGVSLGLHMKGLEAPHNISIYPGGGTIDGNSGDHVLLCPPYNSSPELIEEIVDKTAKLIEAFFDDLGI